MFIIIKIFEETFLYVINCKDSPWPGMRNAELYIHISFKTGNTHLKLLQEQVKINHLLSIFAITFI